MNKNKKIVAAVVSIVMAGTMVGSLAGCVNNTPTDDRVTLPISIGNNNDKTGVTFVEAHETAMAGKKLGGSSVIAGGFKPAWKQVSADLDIKFNDLYQGVSASDQYSTVTSSDAGMAGTAIMTMSATSISTYGSQFLDINQYLNKLPNYKAFLENNPVVWASLLYNTDGATVMLPYFDGNDDIEKYVLVQKAVVKLLLDSTDVSKATGTFAGQVTAKQATDKDLTLVGTSASVQPYMGSTNWKVETTKPGDATKTGWVTVDYTAAATAANTEGTALYNAIKAAYADYTSVDNGNIITIQNAVINGTEGAVTGAQLIKITQEYVKVAYKYSDTKDGEASQLYGATVNGVTTKLSDVFNSNYAAWDADLYAALGRCFVTATGLSDDLLAGAGYTYLYAARANDTQRGSDTYALAGELYGVRGLDSRYNFSYIGEDGTLKDSRANAKAWQAMVNINNMAKEGLINTVGSLETNKNLQKNDGKVESLSLRDFVQTQTAVDFTNTKPEASPILTPVSKWDVDDNGTDETIMRFTESWRGVKDGGLVVSKAWFDAASEKEQEACLKFIDYCYSNDGKKVMTYGSFSSNGNGSNANGTWYGKAYSGDLGGVTVTNGKADLTALKNAGVIATHDNSQYYVTSAYESKAFMYGNVLYTGTYYNGRQIPTMTDNSLENFHGVGNNSFTDYARQYLGSTLPAFEKDQGFEFQCTSESGKAGALIVADALVNGTIKHQYQTLDGTDSNGKAIAKIGGGTGNSMWYTLVPTVLPYSESQKTTIGGANLNHFSGTSTASQCWFESKSKGAIAANYYLTVAHYGVSKIDGMTSVDDIVNLMKYIGTGSTETNYINQFVGIKDTAWQSLLTWYKAN
ncbi:MAG: hypothetical protein K2K38_03195 [Clostridia bacterium]|nr:hypothetical protein [Clostridia bacterium]